MTVLFLWSNHQVQFLKIVDKSVYVQAADLQQVFTGARNPSRAISQGFS